MKTFEEWWNEYMGGIYYTVREHHAAVDAWNAAQEQVDFLKDALQKLFEEHTDLTLLFDELEKERDELKAQSVEKTKGIQLLSIGLGFALCHADGAVRREDVEKLQRDCDDLLNESNQSLTEIKAQAVEEAAEEFISKHYDIPAGKITPEEAYKWMMMRANQLRNQKEPTK